MNARRIWADLLVFARGYIRNPLGLFFSIIFPLILIGLFGLIFSYTGNNSVTLVTENQDHNSNVSRSFLSALNATGAVKVQLVDPGSTPFASYLVLHRDPIGLVIPAGFQANFTAHQPVHLTLYTTPGDPTSSGIAAGAVNGVVNGFNLKAAGGSAIVSVTTGTVGSQVFKYIDYLVPGLIGFSILTSPMFAMVDISSSYRKDRLFRQLSLTPLTKSEWLAAKILWYIGLTFVSAAVMVAAGTLLFGAHVTLSLGVLPFLVLGPFLFVSLGMLAGSVARTPETAAIIGNIITFPMMVLAGSFFPVSPFYPEHQAVAKALPLYYIIDGMNQVMLFQNTADALTDAIVVAGIAVVFFVAAVLAFRWRDS